MRALIDQLERRPETCIWEITAACNLRCLHCESEAGRRDPEELGPEASLALCADLADLGCRVCNLSGGEPLLRADWPVLATALASRAIQVNLVTNGTLLDAVAIQTAQAAGVTGIAVSLDGLQGTHDEIRVGAPGAGSSFRRTLAALDRVVESPMKAGVITHVNAWNLGELDALHDLLAERRIDTWQIQLALPAGRLRTIERPYLIAPAELPVLFDRLVAWLHAARVPLQITDTIGYYTELEPVIRASGASCPTPFWTGCLAGCLVMGIESNGNVTGCPSMPPEFVAGNLRREPLGQIWNDADRFAYNTRWDDAHLTGQCATCAFGSLCRAGCTSMAYAVTGTIYDNPYCLHRVTRAGAGRGAG